MNGEGSKDEELRESEDGVDEEAIVDDPDATVVLTETDEDDSLGETVADLNVDALVEKIEKTDAAALAKKREAKKRLEELQDKLHEDDEFGSTYAFDLDEDLSS